MKRPGIRVRRPCRQAAWVFCAAGALLVGTLLTARAAGLRVNGSASMPEGLWRLTAAHLPLRRGEIVVVCLPQTAVTREAASRGYIPAGTCAGGLAPLLKPVAAVSGDVVMVSAAGLAVNGRLVANGTPLLRDSAGRALRPMPMGPYPVAPGKIWLLSGHDPRSFDSRYFGPVPTTAVQGVAHPLWVLR